jgi:hypothetical protein
MSRDCGERPCPVPRPFTPHSRQFAAKPLIRATQSGIIGLHGQSSRVQKWPCNGGKGAQDDPNRG